MPFVQGLDWAKGLVGNGIGLSLLFGLAAVLGLEKYALLALAVQWATWLCHGLPYKSEKFYDLSGSLTHLLVNGLALLHGAGCAATGAVRGPVGQGYIRREKTSEVALGAVGGGCQSGLGRLLSVTNAIEAGTCPQGDSGWA